MSSILEVQGPIEVDFMPILNTIAKQIRKEHIEAFWSKPEVQGLELKQGCYVFSIRAGKGHTPWYVGKTTKGFKHEIFQPHKLDHYNQVLASGIKGTPVIFFIAPDGTRVKVPQADIDDIETYLIHTARHKNPEIMNIAKTKLPDWKIAGIHHCGKGSPSQTAKVFSKMMGLHR